MGQDAPAWATQRNMRAPGAGTDVGAASRVHARRERCLRRPEYSNKISSQPAAHDPWWGSSAVLLARPRCAVPSAKRESGVPSSSFHLASRVLRVGLS